MAFKAPQVLQRVLGCQLQNRFWLRSISSWSSRPKSVFGHWTNWATVSWVSAILKHGGGGEHGRKISVAEEICSTRVNSFISAFGLFGFFCGGYFCVVLVELFGWLVGFGCCLFRLLNKWPLFKKKKALVQFTSIWKQIKSNIFIFDICSVWKLASNLPLRIC